MGRIPNTQCFNCQVPIYRRPFELSKFDSVFCGHKCRADFKRMKQRSCEECSKLYQPDHATRRFCSKVCATRQSRGPKQGVGRNRSKAKLELLEATECMVLGCKYNLTLDVHRVVPGRMGGEYVVGNMFAICPNHHAEVERGICELIKVDDKNLERRQLVTQPPC
jgi:hypothetical protein